MHTSISIMAILTDVIAEGKRFMRTFKVTS